MFADLFGVRVQGRYCSVIVVVFSQALDFICHNLRNAKLRHFGFQVGAIKWVKSYLEKRLQITRVGKDISPPLEKLRGVPQRSCLKPILFALYNTDLPSCVRFSNMHTYADDFSTAPILRSTYKSSRLCKSKLKSGEQRR